MRITYISALFVTAYVGSCGASISFTGTLSDPNDVFLQEFSLSTVSDVTIQTWSYGGGVNFESQTIPPGGFDPLVALFASDGSFVDENDDGDCPPANFYQGGCFDSTLFEPELQPGMYTLSLTASPNGPAGVSLIDGFTGGGDFFGLNSDFAVDVLIQSDAALPEPRSSILVLAGLILVTGIRFAALGQPMAKPTCARSNRSLKRQ